MEFYEEYSLQHKVQNEKSNRTATPRTPGNVTT